MTSILDYPSSNTLALTLEAARPCNISLLFENCDHNRHLASLNTLHSFLVDARFHSKVCKKVLDLESYEHLENKMHPYVDIVNKADVSLLKRQFLKNQVVRSEESIKEECKLLFRFICVLQSYGVLGLDLKNVGRYKMFDVVVHFRLLFTHFVQK